MQMQVYYCKRRNRINCFLFLSGYQHLNVKAHILACVAKLQSLYKSLYIVNVNAFSKL